MSKCESYVLGDIFHNFVFTVHYMGLNRPQVELNRARAGFISSGVREITLATSNSWEIRPHKCTVHL